MTEYMGLSNIRSRLPDGTHPNCLHAARTDSALPEPDLKVGITVEIPAWGFTTERAQRWINQALRFTGGGPVQRANMKILRAWGAGYLGHDDEAAAQIGRDINLRKANLRKLIAEKDASGHAPQPLPWWNAHMTILGTYTDIAYVCTNVTRNQARYRLRDPNGWWHSRAIPVGQRVGYQLSDLEKIIADNDWQLDHERWDLLVDMCADNPIEA